MLNFVRRVKALQSLMSISDAAKMATKERTRNVSFDVHMRGLRHPLTLRAATTDVLCFDKIFLKEEYRLPFDLEPKLIIDAGANIGLATLYFSRRYPNAKILAIEPDPQNFLVLLRNCLHLENVTPIEGALWSGNVDRLSLVNPEDGAWSYQVKDGNGEGNVAAVSVPQLIELAGADRVDLLKLDIEGAERQLFLNGADSWLDRVSVIAIELHDRILPGCSAAFYSQLVRRQFSQEVRGENIFIDLRNPN